MDHLNDKSNRAVGENRIWKSAVAETLKLVTKIDVRISEGANSTDQAEARKAQRKENRVLMTERWGLVRGKTGFPSAFYVRGVTAPPAELCSGTLLNTNRRSTIPGSHSIDCLINGVPSALVCSKADGRLLLSRVIPCSDLAWLTWPMQLCSASTAHM